MRLYATTEQLAGDPWNSEPDNAGSLLRSASLLIDSFLVQAVYPVDSFGAPSDSALTATLRDATCAQVVAWVALGINPVKGAADQPAATPIASKGLGSAQISYDRGSSQDRATAQSARSDIATGLAPEARQILSAAGLLGSAVWAYG